MTHFSLTTSLYRPLPYLRPFAQAVAEVGRALPADHPLELILVHNDPTLVEQTALTAAIRTIQGAGVRVTRLETPRETLYASWNRGFQAASGDWLGAWNVDDERTATGLSAAAALFTQGVALVDFPYEVVSPVSAATQQPAPYNPHLIAPRRALGPFFLTTRALFQQAGDFNPHFRIVGDFEWATRPAVRASSYQAATIEGGTFHRHANTLSGSANPREWIEFNIALIWRGQYSQLRPVEPTAMRTAWENWGHSGADLPPTAADWLWGEQASARYQRYRRARQQPAWRQRVVQAGARRGWWHSLLYELAVVHPLRALNTEGAG